MRVFEMWAELRNLTDKQLHSALVSALRDGAREFAYNVEYNGRVTYKKLREALMDNYGDSAMRHYYQLKGLKRGNRTIAEYNEAFQKLRNKAKRFLANPVVEVEHYVEGLWPYELRLALQTNRPANVQCAMELA